MRVWKDKSGKWIDVKEFTERFKKGVDGITPLQQARSTLFGYYIILLGIIIGLVVNFRAHIWWLFIILLGSLFVSGTALLGQIQKYRLFKKQEELFNQADLEVKGGSENEE